LKAQTKSGKFGFSLGGMHSDYLVFGTLEILLFLCHGFAKKSQEVPKKEIAIAEERKTDYFKRKTRKMRSDLKRYIENRKKE
jgi:hypothetical protein